MGTIGKAYVGSTQILPAYDFKPIAGWTPASLPNAIYWWRADQNVTTDANGVVTWTDILNRVTSNNQSTRVYREPVKPSQWFPPSLTTSSNLNNQAVIRFTNLEDLQPNNDPQDPAQLVPGISSQPVTMLQVTDLISTNGGVVGGVYTTTTSNSRWWVDTANGDLNKSPTTDEGAAFTLESPVTLGPKTITIFQNPGVYGQIDGTFRYGLNSIGKTIGSTGGIYQTGWTADSRMTFGPNVEQDVAEQLWIYGDVSYDDLQQWRYYVNQRYGSIVA